MWHSYWARLWPTLDVWNTVSHYVNDGGRIHAWTAKAFKWILSQGEIWVKGWPFGIFLALPPFPSLHAFLTHERALPEVLAPEQDLVQCAASSDTRSVQRHHQMLVIHDLFAPHWAWCSLPPGNRNCYASVQSSWHIGWRWQAPSYPPRLRHRKLPSPVSHTSDGEGEFLLSWWVGGWYIWGGGMHFSKNMSVRKLNDIWYLKRWKTFKHVSGSQSWRESMVIRLSLRELLRMNSKQLTEKPPTKIS